jgi:hypothetical protein
MKTNVPYYIISDPKETEKEIKATTDNLAKSLSTIVTSCESSSSPRASTKSNSSILQYFTNC